MAVGESASDRRREVILDVVAMLVQDIGPCRLTPALVAEHAGVDAAEVEALFPTTDALCLGVARRMVAAFHERVSAAISDGARSGDYLRGVVATKRAEVENPSLSAVARALIATDALGEAVGAYVRAERTALQRAALDDAPDRMVAEIVLAALDGLWFATILEVEGLSVAERTALLDRLEAMVSGD